MMRALSIRQKLIVACGAIAVITGRITFGLGKLFHLG